MSDSESEESDWEEVKEEDYILPKNEEDEEEEITAKEYTEQLAIPKEGIQITIEDEDGTGAQRKKKKGFDMAGYIRRQVNRRKKELQEDIHKTHILCLFSRGMLVNQILISEDVLAVGLSVLPSKQAYPPKNLDLSYLENFMKWFRKTFKVQEDLKSPQGITSLADIRSSLCTMITSKKVVNQEFLVFIFVVILRALSVQTRLVMSLQPIPLKPPSSELMQDPSRKGKGKANVEGEATGEDNNSPSCSSSSKNSQKKTVDGPKNSKGASKSTSKSDSKSKTTPTKKNSASPPKRAGSEAKSKPASRSSSGRASKSKSVPLKNSSKDEDDFEPSDESDDPDSDFDMSRSRSRKRKKAEVKKETPKAKKTKKELGKGRKMVSSDEEDSGNVISESTKKVDKGRKYVDVWAEVYLEEEERWVSVDLMTDKIMCDADFESKATPPLIYVMAFGNDERTKDVTRRYASRWLTGTQKLRADKTWWQQSLRPFLGRRTRQDKEEDKLLDQQLLNQPMPSSVQEVKNHPLYAMRRHLLKFEAIYPAEAPPVGFIKNEPVYSRSVVFTLHSRELWIKQAKVVRVGELPYKIVTARPKWDRMTSTVIKDRPLELFGEWQVEDFIPPPAVDGKVPRNDYGNVELFKPCMLPKGTIHLKEPGLNRVAKKLGIDCAPALIGFEFHSGGSHPTYDGFVVCEEFKDILLDAWREDQIQVLKREEERRRKRVRENWKRLIRMVIVRRRLERKYDSFRFSNVADSSTSSATSSGGKVAKKRPTPSESTSSSSCSTKKRAEKATKSSNSTVAGSRRRRQKK